MHRVSDVKLEVLVCFLSNEIILVLNACIGPKTCWGLENSIYLHYLSLLEYLYDFEAYNNAYICR